MKTAGLSGMIGLGVSLEYLFPSVATSLSAQVFSDPCVLPLKRRRLRANREVRFYHRGQVRRGRHIASGSLPALRMDLLPYHSVSIMLPNISEHLDARVTN